MTFDRAPAHSEKKRSGIELGMACITLLLYGFIQNTKSS